MTGNVVRLHACWAFVLALGLGACGVESSASADVAFSPPADAAPADLPMPFEADPDGEHWFLSAIWLEASACRAKAELLYLFSGLRMRGESREDQLRSFRDRPDIGDFAPHTIAGFESMLDTVYAASESEVRELGTAAAADCLAATPSLGIDRPRALHCYRRHQAPYVQHMYRDQLPIGDDIDTGAADFAFHRCLRGDPD